MMTHIIQVRDMIAELQRHDPCTELVGFNGGAVPLGRVTTRMAGNRRVIVVELEKDGDFVKLEEKFDELEKENIKARGLLERFDSIRHAGGTPDELYKAKVNLHEDVNRFLTNRTTL